MARLVSRAQRGHPRGPRLRRNPPLAARLAQGGLAVAAVLAVTASGAAAVAATPGPADAAAAAAVGQPAGRPTAGNPIRLPQAEKDFVDRTAASRSTAARSGARAGASVRGWHTINVVRVKSASGRTAAVDDARIRRSIKAVDDYYRITTNGQVRVRVGRIVAGWVKAPSPCYLGSAYAAASRFRLKHTGRQHVMAYTAADCPFAGLGEKPGNHFTVTRMATSFTIAHELGHNLGLDHSNSSGCSLAFDKQCTSRRDGIAHREYGDTSDIMGGADDALDVRLGVTKVTPGLGPLHLQRLGLLPASQIVAVNAVALAAPKAVTLVDRQAQAAGKRYLRLADGRGTVWLSLVDGGLVVQKQLGAYPLALNAHGVPPMSPFVSYPVVQGPVSGGSYPLTGGARLVVRSIKYGKAHLAVLPGATRDATDVTVQAGPPGRAATVRWAAKADPTITGWRVVMTGPAPGVFDLPRVPKALSVPAVVDGDPVLPANARSVLVRGLATKVAWRASVVAVRGEEAGQPTPSALVTVRQSPSWRPAFTMTRSGQRLTVAWDSPPDPEAQVDFARVMLGTDASAHVVGEVVSPARLNGPVGAVRVDVVYANGEWTTYLLGKH